MSATFNFGQHPWQQRSWDWRAAGNFICGGAGSGLIIFATLAGPASGALLLAGLALIGLGLTCVWLEIGRPLRALHVFFNPRTSWMSREAIAATLLFPIGLAAAWTGISALAWLAAALALVFVYCQSRMLQAARGIPAWREPLLVPLMLATAAAEGGGLFWLAQPLHGQGGTLPAVLAGVFVIARAWVWLVYRGRLAGRIAPRAQAALDRAGRTLLIAGTIVPLLAIVAAVAFGSAVAAAIAGIGALLAGSFVKYTLVTRAGYNQGFSLAHRPVRGVRPSLDPS